MFDPPVLRTKTAYMQRLADLVRLGNRHHVSGEVALDRACALVRKFRDLYLVHLPKDRRYRRKRAGLGNAHLVLWQPDIEAPTLTFTLLVTSGDHPAHRLEQLRDAYDRRHRLRVGADYELVQHTRAAAPAAAGSAPGKAPRPSLSWRLTAEREQAYRDEFRDLIRRNAVRDLVLRWNSIHRIVGFALARRQVFEIRSMARAEWRRSRKGAFPAKGTRIAYVSRVPHHGPPLSALIRTMNRIALSTAAPDGECHEIDATVDGVLCRRDAM
jgi:hypothetical protein